jgi:hypothetical protein
MSEYMKRQRIEERERGLEDRTESRQKEQK